MNWIATLEQLAPTVASALGTPVAGMAVAALEQALGVPGAADVQKTIEQGQLTGDQVAAIQQAELNLKQKAQELGLDFEQLAVQDRTSARTMQSTTRSWIPGALAIGITSGFFGVLWYMMTHHIPVEDRDVLNIMVGSLGTAWISIVTFYFGSSASSQDKNAILANITAK